MIGPLAKRGTVVTISQLLECVISGWSAALGDASLLDWLTALPFTLKGILYAFHSD